MGNKSFEVNFDGLVGPTHNYSGLSLGNIASTTHQAQISNPREAVLQGLEKMKALHDLGLKQALLPPQERPDIAALRRIGFTGTDADVIKAAAKESPRMLAACSSASSMWTANAGTMAPSCDTADGKAHFTPANLVNKFHRSIEPETTSRIFRRIFEDESRFAHHEPLATGGEIFGDEGAANHTRLAPTHGAPGIHFFVYGRASIDPNPASPKKFPARQTVEASRAIAKLHQLRPEATVFAQQSAEVIDQGVFHNDVICVGNEGFLFYHEQAFQDPGSVAKLAAAYANVAQIPLKLVCVRTAQVSVDDTVKSYLFNSQLVTMPDGKMSLIAPSECEKAPSVKKFLENLVADSTNPVAKVLFFDLRQSMRNGGGPACLRFRAVLTEDELVHCNQGVIFTEKLYAELKAWAQKHYRDRLAPEDLGDPKLLTESRTALDELTRILKLGSLYPFQLCSAR